MKKLAVALTLSLLSVSAFGFIPHKKPTDTFVTSDYIYLKDQSQQLWKTTTTCDLRVTEDSRVSVKTIGDRVKLDSRIIVVIDREKFRCRVTGFNQVAPSALSVSYNQ